MKTYLSPLTPFMESIHALARRCERVPTGWQAVFNDTLVKLAAVDCTARGHVILGGPYTDDLNLRLTQSDVDHAVARVLGRLERATAQTCEICARPGRVRSLGSTVRILCGSCAGPRLAFVAVTRLLQELDETASGDPSEEIWWAVAPVQLRPVIPASAWQVLHVPGTPTPVEYTSHARLREHRTWLEAVHRALDQAVDAQGQP